VEEEKDRGKKEKAMVGKLLTAHDKSLKKNSSSFFSNVSQLSSLMMLFLLLDIKF